MSDPGATADYVFGSLWWLCYTGNAADTFLFNLGSQSVSVPQTVPTFVSVGLSTANGTPL